MKRKINTSIFPLIIMGLVLVSINGCKKNNDPQDPTPAQKQYAWVVGVEDSTSYAMILFSPDGGDTWLRQGEGSLALQNNSLFDVWAVDSNIVWAVGANSCIIKTNDGGKTWVSITSQQIPPATNLQSISMVGYNDIWISGESGTVLNSKDGGNTWNIFDTAFFHSGLMQGIYAINSKQSMLPEAFL